MTMLAAYDRARRSLAEVNSASEVVQARDLFEHVKLYAKQIQDKALLEEAVIAQMRADRRLGEIIDALQASGKITQGRRPKDDTSERVTLKEIGVKSRKMSSRAQMAAALSAEAFSEIEEETRRSVRSGGAILVDPIGSRQSDKKTARETRERILGGVQLALPDKKYGVIYADPEWRFEVYSRKTGMDRSADNHYPTSETDAICARPVQDIAADDCVLFLWATVPMLPDALRVMAAWGFTYKSHCIWVKDKIGTGYWFRNQHELLLVGVKGDNLPAPAMGTQFPSLIEAPVGKHSEKPDAFYELIEAYFPTLPKIEMNARRKRDGWQPWGLEAPQNSGEAA